MPQERRLLITVLAGVGMEKSHESSQKYVRNLKENTVQIPTLLLEYESYSALILILLLKSLIYMTNLRKTAALESV